MTKLTQTVQKGGCAAKVAASELHQILEKVTFPKAHPELLIDGRFFDDAAVYKVTEDLALVQTLDFFTPVVDTPKIFGKVAAANALSDVYAMGASVKTAMVILAYPNATFEKQWIVDMLQGISEVVQEAKGNVVGGHTIDDDTLKLGLSVTGYVHPDNIWSNQNAKPGDLLILTKPLGTGTHTAALKRQQVTEEDIVDVIESMTQLNNVSETLLDTEKDFIHAATDITGFGLIGHGLNLARASNCSLNIELEKIPFFKNTLQSLENGFLTKAHRSNKDYALEFTDWSRVNRLQELLVCDPQTSGGLLLAVDPAQAGVLLDRMTPKFSAAAIIGNVTPYFEKYLRFE